jgi:hypothetical protein
VAGTPGGAAGGLTNASLHTPAAGDDAVALVVVVDAFGAHRVAPPEPSLLALGFVDRVVARSMLMR